MPIWCRDVGAILTEDSHFLTTENDILIIAKSYNTASWTLVAEITTPTWNVVSAWVWEHRLVKWEEANTKWEDAG